MVFTLSLKSSSEENTTLTASASDMTAFFDVSNVQTDYVILYLEYTQDASSLVSITTSTKITDYSDYYQETTIDLGLSTISAFSADISSAGNYRIVLPVTKDADVLKVVFTPDSMLCSDTLDIFFREELVHGRGGR